MSTNANGITKRTNFYFADPARIKIQPKGDDKRNTRFDFGEMDTDLGSMLVAGFHKHQPLLVKRLKGDPDFDFELVDGERRLTFVLDCLKTGKVIPGIADEGVPIVIEDEKTPEAELIVRMITANTGKRFNPLEEAHAIKKLRDLGMSVKGICKNLGKYERQVREALDLLNADASVQKAVEKKEVPVSLARAVATKHKGDKEKQRAVIEKAAKADKKGKAAIQDEVLDTRRRKLKDGEEDKRRRMSPSAVTEFAELCEGELKNLLKEAGITELATRKAISDSSEHIVAYRLGVAHALRRVLGHHFSLIG